MNATQNSPKPPTEIRIRSTSASGNDIILIDTGDPFDFQVMTDADESMLGEARHKTIGGRGVVGRLIDKKASKR